MSGGHWDYCQYRIEEYLDRVGTDGYVIMRFPKLAQVLRDLGVQLNSIVHDLDWDISGDTIIDNDKEFEEASIKKLGETMNKKFKVIVYEVQDEDDN